MSLRFRESISAPSSESSPWRRRVFCVLLGIAAGGLVHHSLSDHEKTGEQGKNDHGSPNFSGSSFESEKELNKDSSDKLRKSELDYSQQLKRADDLTAENKDKTHFPIRSSATEKEEDHIATSTGDQDIYVTEFLAGVGTINNFREERHAVVIRDISINLLRDEVSEMDIPENAQTALESLFQAVEKYQERPGNLTARCDIMAATEEIENLSDEDVITAISSSTMLTILFESIKQPGVSLEDLRGSFCEE
jgi:hypothetical protein